MAKGLGKTQLHQQAVSLSDRARKLASDIELFHANIEDYYNDEPEVDVNVEDLEEAKLFIGERFVEKYESSEEAIALIRKDPSLWLGLLNKRLNNPWAFPKLKRVIRQVYSEDPKLRIAKK